MALRPFITAGVAFAAAGAVAATVAIAPPMSPGEVKVAQNTEAKLSADARDLINTFFGEFPGDADAPGTVGTPGVIHQLLQNANVNDPAALQVIDGFFGSGASEVIRIFLTRYGADPVTNTQINLFFNQGLSELVRYRLMMFNADPSQRLFINTLFGGATNDDGGPNVSQEGFSGLAYNFITGTGLSPDQQRAVDTFFNRGELQTELNTDTPDPTDVRPVLDPYGFPVYVGNSNPAFIGFPGLVYNALSDSGLSPDQQETLDDLFEGGTSQVVRTRLLASTTDPNQRRDIIALFGDPEDADAPYGLSENVRWRLLAGANGDQRSMDLTNEFFDNGISGVIRYLLVGPVPEEEGEPVSPPPAPPAPTATTTLVADVEDTSTTEVTADAPATATRKAAAVQTAAPEPAAEPVSAPAAAAPAVAPAPAKSTSSVKEEAAAEEEADTGTKGGNKVEPEIIIPGGGGGDNGSGSWGILGDVAQAVAKHIAGGTKAPAAGGGTTGGTTAGGSTDGADNDGGGDGE